MSKYVIPFPEKAQEDNIEIIAVLYAQNAKFTKGDTLFVAEMTNGDRLEAAALADGIVLIAPSRGLIRKGETIGVLDVVRPMVEPNPSELAKAVGFPKTLNSSSVTIEDVLVSPYQRFAANDAVVEVRTQDGGKHFVGAPEPGWVVRTTTKGQSVSQGEALFVFEPSYKIRKLGYAEGNFPIRVHNLRAKDGQFVQSGDPICTIQDYSGNKVRMKAPEPGLVQTLGHTEGDIIHSPQALIHLLVERPIQYPVSDDSSVIIWTLKPLEKTPPQTTKHATLTAASNPQQLLPEAGIASLNSSAPSISDSVNAFARDGVKASQPPRKEREVRQDSSRSGNGFLFLYFAFILGGGVMYALLPNFSWDWLVAMESEQPSGVDQGPDSDPTIDYESIVETEDWIRTQFNKYYDGGCKKEEHYACTIDWSFRLKSCTLSYESKRFLNDTPMNAVLHEKSHVKYADIADITLFEDSGKSYLEIKTGGQIIRGSYVEWDCEGSLASCPTFPPNADKARYGIPSDTLISVLGYYHQEPGIDIQMKEAFHHLADLRRESCE